MCLWFLKMLWCSCSNTDSCYANRIPQILELLLKAVEPMRVLSRSDFILVNAAWFGLFTDQCNWFGGFRLGEGKPKVDLTVLSEVLSVGFPVWISSCFSTSVFSVKCFISLTSNMKRRNQVSAKDVLISIYMFVCSGFSNVRALKQEVVSPLRKKKIPICPPHMVSEEPPLYSMRLIFRCECLKTCKELIDDGWVEYKQSPLQALVPKCCIKCLILCLTRNTYIFYYS